MHGWILTFDGVCDPNPGGTMGWGWTLARPGEATVDGKGASALVGAAGERTNNAAEYYALGYGLAHCSTIAKIAGPCSDLTILGDSQVVIYQLFGKYQCHKPHLARLRDRCLSLIAEMGADWKAEWIPREQNEAADRLSRAAFFEATGRMPREWGKGGKAK